MSKREPLPMPKVVGHSANCMSCGYSLDGIPAPGYCPECGVRFGDGACVIEFAGVARRAGGPKWRRVVWIVLAIVSIIYFQLIGLIIFSYPWVALVGFAAIVSGVVGMAVSGKQQKKTGVEVFSVTPDGIGRREFRGHEENTEFIRWDGGHPVIKLDRVSRVWARIKIGVRGSDGKQQLLLDAGFRCPAEDLEVLHALISKQICNESLDDRESIPGYDRSVFIASDLDDGIPAA